MTYDNSINPVQSGSYIQSTQSSQSEVEETSLFEGYYQDTDSSGNWEYKPPVFVKGLETYSYYCNRENLPFLVMAPAHVCPDTKMPAIVYLHGDYQTNGEEWTMYENQTPGGIMTEEAGWDLADFNGYIICPQTKEGWDNKDGSEDKECWKDLRELVSDLKNQLNLGKVVIIGGSNGAKGVLDILEHEWAKDLFDFAVVISAFGGHPEKAQLESIGITGDQDTAYDFMKRSYGDNLIIVNSDHNGVVDAAFRRDEDDERFSEQNGISDILEIAFRDE